METRDQETLTPEGTALGKRLGVAQRVSGDWSGVQPRCVGTFCSEDTELGGTGEGPGEHREENLGPRTTCIFLLVR